MTFSRVQHLLSAFLIVPRALPENTHRFENKNYTPMSGKVQNIFEKYLFFYCESYQRNLQSLKKQNLKVLRVVPFIRKSPVLLHLTEEVRSPVIGALF